MFNYYLEHWDHEGLMDSFLRKPHFLRPVAQNLDSLPAQVTYKVWWYKSSQKHQLDEISSLFKMINRDRVGFTQVWCL